MKDSKANIHGIDQTDASSMHCPEKAHFGQTSEMIDFVLSSSEIKFP